MRKSGQVQLFCRKLPTQLALAFRLLVMAFNVSYF